MPRRGACPGAVAHFHYRRHIDGPGPPGATYLETPGYRARLSSAFTLEEVLTEHPDLRVYVMHAGFPLLEDMLAMLYAHPQLHVDIAVRPVECSTGFITTVTPWD